MSAQPPKILLVDDNPLHLRAIAIRLKLSGFSVLTETNALDAVRAAEKTKPDIVVSDLRMPKMDGFMLCRQIRQNETLSHTSMILYSAEDIPPDLIRSAKSMGVATLTLATLNVEPLLAMIHALQASSTVD